MLSRKSFLQPTKASLAPELSMDYNSIKNAVKRFCRRFEGFELGCGFFPIETVKETPTP